MRLVRVDADRRVVLRLEREVLEADLREPAALAPRGLVERAAAELGLRNRVDGEHTKPGVSSGQGNKKRLEPDLFL